MTSKNFIAFDLGATSGRTILGTFRNGTLECTELTRFPNGIMQVGEHFHWNIFSLYEHLIEGLKAAAKLGVEITSIGIDTWGVDFAFVGEDGSILGLPYAYRDPHTEGAPDEYFKKVLPRSEVYGLTGIQVMNFNSLFQLYAMKRDGSSQLAAAKKILFMPDALPYMLTGNMVTEYTIASTSQMLNPATKEMEPKLLETLGLDSSNFAKMVMPGHKVGELSEHIARECGLPRLPVVAVAGHDTGSAVAAVPATDKGFAYLSSGTWSLMGIEVDEPVISERTAKLNITNEGGVEGTIRLLKNITGLWILERCLAEWKAAGKEYSYPQVVAMAESADSFKSFIDPDNAAFANPKSMTAAITSYCKETGQSVPTTDAAFIRLIFESLALKYRYVLDLFKEFSPNKIEKLHIIGGGSRNALLNQFAANSTGLEVVAGPQEATAIGNIMLQAKASRMIKTLPEMRQVISQAVQLETFTPQEQAEWTKAYERFVKLM